MAVSVFDLFKIGIGPSSSHTVGPMRAARLFVQRLGHEGLLARVAQLKCGLYGSLGATGRGHGSDKAVLLGLLGEAPDTVAIEAVPALLHAVRHAKALQLPGGPRIAFAVLFFLVSGAIGIWLYRRYRRDRTLGDDVEKAI